MVRELTFVCLLPFVTLTVMVVSLPEEDDIYSLVSASSIMATKSIHRRSSRTDSAPTANPQASKDGVCATRPPALPDILQCVEAS